METSRVLNASRGLPVEVRSNIELDIPTEGTFTEFVLQRAQQFGDRIALVDGDTGRSYSYSELRCNVIRCAAALYDVGVRRGDRVCVLLNNCVEFPIVMLAVMQLEAICVPTSYLCTKYELRDLVVDCSPFVYVTRSNQIDKLMYVTPLLSSKHVIITIDDVISAEETRDVMSLDSLLRSTTLDKHRQSVIETSNVADNRRLVALICYSSGTTGKPKGCMQTHHALIANGCMNNATFCSSHFQSLSSGDVSVTSPVDEVTVAVLPLYHIYAIEMYMTHALTTGFKVITMQRFDREQFLGITECHKVSLLHVVPPLLADLFNNTDELRLRRAMASVRVVISAAVCLTDKLAREFAHRLPNADICQLYGMSEIMASHGAPPASWKYGSIGRPMANTSAKVVDVTTRQVVGPNIDGEILVKSPCVFAGYWKNEHATQNSFDDEGWFKTGDVGHHDDDGNFFIVDRLKDMLKYKGHTVAPAEIEAVILLHPDVVDAAVVGVPDDTVGDLPRAFVVTRRRNATTAEDVLTFVNERVAPFKRLRAGVEIVDVIPEVQVEKYCVVFCSREVQLLSGHRYYEPATMHAAHARTQ